MRGSRESISIKCLKKRLTYFFQLYKGRHQDSPCTPHDLLSTAADGEKDPSQSPLSLGPPLPMTTLITTEGQEVMRTTMMMDMLNLFLDTRMTGCLSLWETSVGEGRIKQQGRLRH